MIVLFCSAADAGLFIRDALNAGVGGPGFMWVGSDATVKEATSKALTRCDGTWGIAVMSHSPDDDEV